MIPSLPATHPAEVIDISPEALEVANCYLQFQDIIKVSTELDIPITAVTALLDRKEVKSYMDHVFMNMGFNNRFKMRSAMDAILAKKFQDMDESAIGSQKDIAELMALSHKMAMDHLAAQMKLEELREKNNLKTQTNIQINDTGGNYGNLIERIMSNGL